MKRIKTLFISCLVAAMAVSCEKGIDPITPLAPGNDVEDPTIEINYPVTGKPVRLQEGETLVTFKVTATDDIEIASVKLDIDGTEIGTVNSFKDYRRAVINYDYDGLTDGDHKLTVTVTDLAGKSKSKFVNFRKVTVPPYTPMEGEVLYLPFDGDFTEYINGAAIAVTGSPSFSEGINGDAYQGNTDSYITLSTDGIISPEFSIAFWINVNASPDRAGIIAISPVGESRAQGLRLFREGTATEQKLGLNFGDGTAEVWMNPFYTFNPDGSWIHVALSIGQDKAVAYINGEQVMEYIPTTPAPIDWTGVTSITIGSGMPNFVYWQHFSDLSKYDDMHFFNRAITAEEAAALATPPAR
ncbi:MAG TPA: LamG-like jellyroll fold domain-containing protein [Lentimicrobium sp.]|nr:LamG-like jellyroll fold domain-containing protein [Lentimicrobium sp.]